MGPYYFLSLKYGMARVFVRLRYTQTLAEKMPS